MLLFVHQVLDIWFNWWLHFKHNFMHTSVQVKIKPTINWLNCSDTDHVRHRNTDIRLNLWYIECFSWGYVHVHNFYNNKLRKEHSTIQNESAGFNISNIVSWQQQSLISVDMSKNCYFFDVELKLSKKLKKKQYSVNFKTISL